MVRGIFDDGIKVTIVNSSSESLHDCTLRLLNVGPEYSIGDLPAHSSKHLSIKPKTDSHGVFSFRASDGTQHSATVIGYVENGYVGKVKVEVKKNYDVVSSEKLKPSSY